MKETVSLSIGLLTSTSKKLNSLAGGLKQRDQKFFVKCIEAQLAKNHTKAILYANECAEVRKLARLVISSELALEQALLRLQTIDKLGDVLGAVTPILEIIEETKGKLGKSLPSVAGKLNEINLMLKSSCSEMGSTDLRKDVPTNSLAATKILREANLAAEDKIREKFPKLPQDFETSKEITTFRIPVALTATGEESAIEGEATLKQQVYNYVKAYPTQFSIIRCASFLETSQKNIERALLELKEEGRLELG